MSEDQKHPGPSGNGKDGPPRSNGEVRGAWRLETEQQSSEADQTGSDRDQTSSDTDQQASDVDQEQSNVDQRASDRDQAAANRELGPDPGVADKELHDLSRAERVEGTSNRASASAKRSQAAADRDRNAEERDEVARGRDAAADARDEDAEARERALLRRAEIHGPVGERLVSAFEQSADARSDASDARERAAQDRLKAAADREQAALDRARASAEIRRGHLDDLTGAYGRELGETLLREEIERARRAELPLTLAYLGVDGISEANDRDGQAAGDNILREAAAAVRSGLGDDDPLVRMGGPEFVCTLAGLELDDARKCFAQIEQTLSSETAISVGFASLRPDEGLEGLLARGDKALHRAGGS